MERYGEPLVTTVSDSINTSQFGDLEMIGSWAAIKKAGVDAMWNIGTGGSVDSTPVIHDDVIYFGSYDNNVYAVDIPTRSLKWKFGTKNMCYCNPIIYNKRVYFCSSDGNYYCVSSQGKLVWKFRMQGPGSVEATLHNGILYVGSWDCHLYALGAETGKLVWKFKTSLSYPAPVDAEAAIHHSTFEVVLPAAEETARQGKYKQEFLVQEAGIESDYIIKSEYVVKSQYTTGKKVKSMSSGWGEKGEG